MPGAAQVNDRQARVAQTHIALRPHAAVVVPAMMDRFHHALQIMLGYRRVIEVNDAADTTHREWLIADGR